MEQRQSVQTVLADMRKFLAEKMIPFWLERSVDPLYGGFLTSMDEQGVFDGNGAKYLVTQCRMIWGFSYLLPFAREQDRVRMRRAAEQGVRFLSDHFYDPKRGGFYWQLHRDGSIADPAKLVYGESFALYALAEYGKTFGDKKAVGLACETFDLLQKYAADTRCGGYFENLEADWSQASGGVSDRKSLDIHMHLLEAYTTLCQAAGGDIHFRKLKEVLDLLMDRMVSREAGYGFNQFDRFFRRVPAVSIPRTWNAEREAGQSLSQPLDTTSYGHNIELSWLCDQALGVLNIDREPYEDVLRGLLDHSLRLGYDRKYGGVYRDGLADESALVTDKEWWQNFEAMVGYANGFLLYRAPEYLDAFLGTWSFIWTYFLHRELGESRQLLDRRGGVLVGNLGNSWKGIYHTGRALAECILRLEALENEHA